MKRLCVFLACLVLVGINLAQAQTVRITGTVTSSEDGMPIPGVSVVVKGTTVGAATNVDGKFELNVSADAQTLMFSSIGFKAQEVAISGRTIIDIILESESMQVEELVVTALGIKREKREVTYQTQKVADEDLTKISPTRAASALTGKVAGLQINVQDNGVNPSSQILLRGLRSVSASNSALIVIDGSIASQGAFDNLNPNDIANISVLKGATAAALYGSAAGNGALLVTTKTGAAGSKLTVGLNSSYTIDKVAYMPKFQSKYGTGWEGAYDAVENTNWGPRFDGTLRQIGPTFADGSYQAVPYAPVKNNLLDFYQTGNTQTHTAYMSGSNADSKFYVSFGDQRSNGIVLDDTYRRNTLRVNASKKVGKVELSVSTSYFTDKTDVVGSTIGSQDRPLYWFLLNTSANIPLKKYSDWKNPKSYGYADNYYNAYYQNPYWAVGTNRNTDETNRLVGNVNMSYDIVKWLNFTGRVGVNSVWGRGKNWRAAQTYSPTLKSAMDPVTSFVEDTEFQDKSYTGDAIFTGDFKFNESFTLKAIAGATVNAREYRYHFIRANNLSIPGFYDISNGTGSLQGTADALLKRSFGVFTDLTFGYNNYLFLNASGRYDKVSTLAPENNGYFYPAVGLSFVATDAIPALKDKYVLSYAKATMSNSTVYNDLDPYLINESYSQSTGFPYGSVNGFFLSGTTVDANITKEKINTTEFGLNLGFLRGKIWLDASYYVTKTSDLITQTTPSITSGSSVFLTNIGGLKGKGIEVTVGGTIINANDLKWDLSVNYTSQETTVSSIKAGLDEIALTTTGQYGVYAVVDEAFPQIKANVYKRDPKGRIVVDAVSGHPLTETGLKNMGKTTPDYILGFTSTVKYKGIALSATMDYRTGHVYYEQGSDAMEFTGRSLESVSANRQDFVIPNSVIETAPGVYVKNTNIPVSGGRQSYWTDVYNDVKSNYVKDATALKLRELSLSYELPVKFLAKTPIKKLTVGFIARNLMTWLPKENAFSDPEFNNTNSNAIGVGGYFQSPPTRSFGFNLNLEF